MTDRNRQHVVTEDGQEFDVETEQVDRDTFRVHSVRGLTDHEGNELENPTWTAPKGAPALGYPFFLIGTDGAGRTFHFNTAPVTSLGDDDREAQEREAHVVAERRPNVRPVDGEAAFAPKDLAEKDAGVKSEDEDRAQERSAEKTDKDEQQPAKAKNEAAKEDRKDQTNKDTQHRPVKRDEVAKKSQPEVAKSANRR